MLIKVTLITTVLNEADSIDEFILSLNSQIEKPDEVIIVDGGSTDGTVDVIKKNISKGIDLHLIVDETCSKKFSRGPIAKGRNTAIRHARHEYILVTDAGCTLSEGWVKEMKKTFIEHDCDVVSGWYKAKQGNRFQSYIADIFCPDVSKVDTKRFLPSSRSVAFKKAIWESVNGYPENSYTAEDTVFSQKILKKAEKVCFNERAIVAWNLPKDMRELRVKLLNYGIGEGVQRLFLWKYVGRVFFLLCFPISFFYLLAMQKKMIVFYIYFYQIKGYFKGRFRYFLGNDIKNNDIRPTTKGGIE